jgi:hypothetical protein
LEDTVLAIRSHKEAEALSEHQKEEEEIQVRTAARRLFRVPEPKNSHIIENAIAQKNAALQESKREESVKQLLSILISRSEMQAISNTFDPVKPLQKHDCVSIAKLIGMSGPQCETELEKLIESLPQMPTPDGFLRLMLQWPLFCTMKEDALYAIAQTALNEGKTAQAMQAHKDINRLTEHMKSITISSP